MACCAVASGKKLIGSPASTAVCESRKNCAYSVVPGVTPCAARPALICGPKVGESCSSRVESPPGMASVPVVTSGVGHHREVRAAHDRSQRVADVVDRGRVHPARDVEGRQRVREGDEIGHALAQVVARGEQARQVDEVNAGGIDDAVRDGGAGDVVLGVQVEGALDRAARRQAEAGIEGIGPRGIEHVVGSAGLNGVVMPCSGRSMATTAKPALRERVGDREHVETVARDAVLEDHHRPAAGRGGAAPRWRSAPSPAAGSAASRSAPAAG